MRTEALDLSPMTYEEAEEEVGRLAVAEEEDFAMRVFKIYHLAIYILVHFKERVPELTQSDGFQKAINFTCEVMDRPEVRDVRASPELKEEARSKVEHFYNYEWRKKHVEG